MCLNLVACQKQAREVDLLPETRGTTDVLNNAAISIHYESAFDLVFFSLQFNQFAPLGFELYSSDAQFLNSGLIYLSSLLSFT